MESLGTEEKIERVIRNRISPSSTKQYLGALKRFITFLKIKFPEAVGVDNSLRLEKLEMNMFKEFIVELPSKLGVSTLRTYRSCLMNEFKLQKVLVSPQFEQEMSVFYEGLSRINAQEKAEGTRKLKEGKEPMPFELYVWLSREFLKNNELFCSLLLNFNMESYLQNEQYSRYFNSAY